MDIKKLDAKKFKTMVALGRERLDEHTEYVNSLNVFPVPDGDTGTNMNLSFTSGANAVKDSASDEMEVVSQALAKGLLMGARGNSGVILSQLFRGFAKALEGKKEIDAADLARAFQAGVDTAYNAVMKPVEGTILTVARQSAKQGSKVAAETDSVIEVMETVLNAAKKSLKKTPDLLPVLKEVGVVDSGGQGLVYIYEGFLSAMTGEEPQEEEVQLEELVRAEHHRSGVHEHVSTEDITYGYCTEIMVRIGEGDTVEQAFDYEEFRNYLDKIGDSLLVVADEEIIKVHVHTEKPGDVMNYGQKFGSLMKIKVDNMREQHSELSSSPENPKTVKDFAVVAIAPGEGLKVLFESLGVDCVLQGGQTMNPSTEDIVKAMESVPAKQYIILPNNKNIFMAAEQAADVVDAAAAVVGTKTIQQGLTAMLGYNPAEDLDTNTAAMTDELELVTSGQVTFAVRDTEINGLAIKKDDYMGLIDGAIKVTASDLLETTTETIKLMVDNDSEIVTLLIGEDGSKEEAQKIADFVEENYPDMEVEIHAGDQPVYPYLISVE
ncbi:Dihydroxyacetone kinase family protein [Alkalibacterium sp. AK22]|uniref:DAK2 domain-containing protein n=1 Tax=Alkalibacterium sp. AK22 TaxID=1229520 RepID=UPI0004459151|nr:DAK2 domain-containing protein [Alkalibacterium sp. AK22]EXJ24220.1 Dihydroxyacetone kinase family protein [Alkalibacterium sp. AK22]